MKPRVRLLTKEELARRARQRKPATFNDVERLRYPRRRTAHVLSRSVATIIRLEKAGVLTPIRDSEKGAVFHSAAQVHKLAGDVQADEAVR